MNKTIVVTGSSGYIGGTICYLLKQKGYKVVAIDIRPQPHLHQYYDVHIVDDFCSYNSFSIITLSQSFVSLLVFVHVAVLFS